MNPSFQEMMNKEYAIFMAELLIATFKHIDDSMYMVNNVREVGGEKRAFISYNYNKVSKAESRAKIIDYLNEFHLHVEIFIEEDKENGKRINENILNYSIEFRAFVNIELDGMIKGIADQLI